MNLTTEVKTHVIITYKGSHHFITSHQEQALSHLTNDSQIRVEGNTIRGGDIAEVLTTEKYYETYPEKQKVSGQAYVDVKSLPGNAFSRSKGNAREKMLAAMKAKYPKAALLMTAGKAYRPGDSYEPENVFDPSKEDWNEFSQRVGLNN